jgi:ribosomal protein S18 acetylase RimI-like enzyme
MTVEYKTNQPITADQFVDLLRASTLAERRPVGDLDCIQGMVSNSNLTITAWDGDRLVGIARSMTDFHYACYLSDLAVHSDYQGSGIGRMLQHLTQQELGPRCKLILISAPSANSYYEHIGFTNNPRCWVLERHQNINAQQK